ncbi:MAG TPA: lytic murein transglycosylase [Thermodesulfobacteriota bacterium]|nr:lytic murein transglycosylase [Thermodesulfobacteriota bacterium]
MERKLHYREDNSLILGKLTLRVLPVLFLAVLLFFPCSVFADWSPLIDRLVADGFDESAIRNLFSRDEARFEPGAMISKLEELIRRSSKKPAGLLSYNPKVVYRGFLKERVITRARSYLRENTDLLEKVSREYCVPREIVVSILLVETRLGDDLGRKRAFNSLACMALCTDLETIRPYLPKKLISPKNEDLARTICRQKADWAYAELRALIFYAFGSGLDPLSLPGSIYGAIGLCQFMPSNVLSYAVDADQDGRIDLFTKADALFSIANYLREHGWKCTLDRANQLQVILDYNKSSVYANTVLAVAEKLKDKSRIKP